ncbi:ADP-ribosylglycohydrolase family protein [Marinobacter sp.]|uniref:ADP-ribosylglycohydrolase family protein n=1 Tax=Marinobacter sp. TaxID=50741 RepID=UPI00384EF764
MNDSSNQPNAANFRMVSAQAGGWVGDAASLGLHWLYDSDRIQQVAPERPEFLVPDPDYFEGGFGFFAHPGKRSGDISHYGAATWVLQQSLCENGGRLEVRDYQRRFRAFFGPGGQWQGYIDNPTRITLDNLSRNEQGAIDRARAHESGLSEKQQKILVQKVLPYTRRLSGDQLREPVRKAIAMTYEKSSVQEAGVALAETIDQQLQPESGADDTQLPAVSKLPPLVACYTGRPDLLVVVEAAVRVTNHNDEAVAWARCVAVLLDALYQGKPMTDALDLAQEQGPDVEKLRDARNTSRLDALSAGDRFGRTCYLHEAMPVIFHILSHAGSFVEAIRANIYCGGDSCGRAWVIGPAMGAVSRPGSECGVPLSWLARVHESSSMMKEAENLIGPEFAGKS